MEAKEIVIERIERQRAPKYFHTLLGTFGISSYVLRHTKNLFKIYKISVLYNKKFNVSIHTFLYNNKYNNKYNKYYYSISLL